jgi:two-component system chemotaxis response regulator CheB
MNDVRRDLVVVGASAGGIDAFGQLLGRLGPDLAAPVLAVQHLGMSMISELPALLARKTGMPVAWASDGAALVPGQVLFAPAGQHLLVHDAHVLLRGGPRENRARPSINRLFRAAAASHGARVVAVVMTGMLDDGAAGAVAVARAGGHVLVQDPSEATHSSMPRHVVEAVPDAECAPLAQLAERVIARIAEHARVVPIPHDVSLEAELDRTQSPDFAALRTLGPQTSVSCPECGGPTWSTGEHAHTTAFRCYLGHATSTRTLVAASDEQVEISLWTALRALEDRATAYEALSRDATAFAVPSVVQSYDERATTTREHAARVRQLLEALRERE